MIAALKKNHENEISITKSGYILEHEVIWQVSNRTTMAWMKQDPNLAAAIAEYCLGGNNEKVRDKACNWHEQYSQ